MTQRKNPVCVAIDTPDLEHASHLVTSLAGHVGMVKIGLEFFYAHGHKGYAMLAETGVPVFLDLKLHDIPNTVAAGLTSLLELDPKPAIINIHASGGPAMIKAGAKAMNGQAKLIAVTILTSLDDSDLSAIGFNAEQGTAEHATSLAVMAKENGADGVVCSPHDLKSIRTACGADFLTVVPGIRPVGTSSDDQKRIATPASAIKDGADILVIGRAITGADDPVAAAKTIVESIAP